MFSSKKPNILECLNLRAAGDHVTDGEFVSNKANDYLEYYGEVSSEKKDNGDLLQKRKNNALVVTDTYYDLVTDFYEYGWGEGFHFAVMSKGESREHSFAKHEYRVALKLQVQPGDTILDIGCGIGGPGRHIASFTGAKVIGVNINDYQLKRCKILTKMAGLDHLCSYEKSDFCNMMFLPEASIEKVYAIESTCHCSNLADVYKEIYRVLKPGGLFVSYEWILTDKYDANSLLHKEIVEGILEGDALPRLNNLQDVHYAIEAAGFEVLEQEDYATNSEVPWYSVLQAQWTLSDFKITPLGRMCTSMMLTVLETLHISPRGSTKVHRMLCKGADNLVRGGQEGIFSPMYFLALRKPCNL